MEMKLGILFSPKQQQKWARIYNCLKLTCLWGHLIFNNIIDLTALTLSWTMTSLSSQELLNR